MTRLSSPAIDDGSVDGTVPILTEFAARDPRVRLINSRGNRGQKQRLAEILHLASGQYTSIADQDDIWISDKTGRLIAAIDEKARDEVGCAPARIVSEGLRATIHWYLENEAWLQAVVDGSDRDWMDRNYGSRRGAVTAAEVTAKQEAAASHPPTAVLAEAFSLLLSGLGRSFDLSHSLHRDWHCPFCRYGRRHERTSNQLP